MTQISLSEKAVAFYSQTPKVYNCAQAVALAFGRDDLLGPMQSCGGGRAPDGLCGALYAALSVAPEDRSERIKTSFQKATGSLLCREIRPAGKVSCLECVRAAAAACEGTVQ